MRQELLSAFPTISPFSDPDCFLSDGAFERLDEATIRAETSLYFSVCSGGYEFLHGADTLIPVGRLVEVLLHPGETLTMIDEFQWRSAAKENMQLTVSTHLIPRPQNQKEVLRGSFRTSKGRAIFVSGISNGTPIDESVRFEDSPITRDLYPELPISQFTVDGWFCSYTQAAPFVYDQISQRESRQTGLHLSGLVDSFGALFSALSTKIFKYLSQGGQGTDFPALIPALYFFTRQGQKERPLALMSQIDRFHLPSPKAFLLNSKGVMWVRPIFEEAKEKGAVEFLPMEFKITDGENRLLGGGTGKTIMSPGV